MDEYGDPEVLDGASLLDFVSSEWRSCWTRRSEDYLIDDDGLIPPDFVSSGLLGDSPRPRGRCRSRRRP